MKAATRRTIEMATRVLNFSRAHPDPSSGYTAALARLEKTLAQVEVVAARQRDGLTGNQARSGERRSPIPPGQRRVVLQLRRYD
jgi:hypothetical protein